MALNYINKNTVNLSNFKAAHQVISLYYGDNTAKRSKLPLMNHINEGVSILAVMQSSHFTDEQVAFCLHPLVQNGVTYPKNQFTDNVNKLAHEYAHYANRYLCRADTDNITTIEQLKTYLGGIPSKGCMLMLLADKIQNQKDFLLYHYGTHKRSEQLNKYFNLWIKFLNNHLINS